MQNGTLRIDDTGDLIFDNSGMLSTVEGNETSAQNVRLTLCAWRGDFDLVPSHGMDYDTLLSADTSDFGVAPEQLVREAVFQEAAVASVTDVVVGSSGRGMSIRVAGLLTDGTRLTTEVVAGG